MKNIMEKFRGCVETLKYTDGIVQMQEFCYSKAVEAWQTWKDYNISPDKIAELSAMPYQVFCTSADKDIVSVRDAIFRVVAYCDTNARDKNTINEYDDKRTVAMAGIYQNAWVKQLLKYKLDPVSVSSGIRNTIAYLENPTENWPIVSETHRQEIARYFCDTPEYDPNSFNTILWSALGDCWEGKNRQNATAFLTHCIYNISHEWKQGSDIAGLIAHEAADGWKYDLQNEMSNGSYGCIWWHKLPNKQHRSEILQKLRSIIDDGDTFDFYYIKNNQAYFKAVVKDFATVDDYAERQEQWSEHNPVWFNPDISEYCDDNHQADIVFLISSFEHIEPGIMIDNFHLYKNRTYNHRTDIVAYEAIETVSVGSIKSTSKMQKYADILISNRNLVLTGAPGTGKTFLAKQIAEMLGATEDNGQCQMVQFHPSMDYTDFVEGLRPVKSDDDSSEVSGFKRHNGVFKQFCADALTNLQKSKNNRDVMFEQNLEDAYYRLVDDIENNEVSDIPTRSGIKMPCNISSDGNIVLTTQNSNKKNVYTVSLAQLKRIAKIFRNAKDLSNINNISKTLRNEIGIGGHSSAFWATLKLIYDRYYQELQEQTSQQCVQLKNFVFIIDEINRGELSKIFGELFFSLDPGYRGEKGRVLTQYQNLIDKSDIFGAGFYVPENVYIIGTMNDIDRSVESMDFAIRRRFVWCEITAEDSAESMNLNAETCNYMTRLNTGLKNAGFSSAYYVGGAYFLKLNSGETTPEELWDYRLSSLLYEYLRGREDADEQLCNLKNAFFGF